MRLLMDRRGYIKLSYSPLNNAIIPVNLALSKSAVNSANLYLYHKTTNRRFYDMQRKQALKKGAGEIIWTNERREITEGSITNIFVLKDGKLITPHLLCGLLPGVLRRYLLDSGKAEEGILYPEDLLRADKIYIGNSVRGLMKANLPMNLQP